MCIRCPFPVAAQASGSIPQGDGDAPSWTSCTALGKYLPVSQVTRLPKALGENQVSFGPRTGGVRSKILQVRRLILRK